MYEIAHVGIVVRNTARSLEFYREVLGCTVIDSYDNDNACLTFLACGRQILELVEYKAAAGGERSAGPVDHIAFAVLDMDAAVSRLKQRNVPLAFDTPRLAGNKKILFFSGPDGERLEFVQTL
ncbi:MAG TPA: VOC family protein [Methylomusa anaerophila]|uniref:Putative lyase n=1 Tax=Methylomusa anaerophila TaxID=1930071 RepID=A0A348AJF3_9FIRM|nr:VOC family protein [Methylomusa anaerophila]BBB91201.1 putative lyase [Methylomusa anaerophila]HML89804.1 VOC family protein [Methylomusa anaerophila]